jgi:hypothetical protein
VISAVVFIVLGRVVVIVVFLSITLKPLFMILIFLMFPLEVYVVETTIRDPP